MEFKEFGKIARLYRPVVVTEKIDGTNAQIFIADDAEPITLQSGRVVPFLCGSRSRWIFPENDNAGFARWAYEHAEELLQLGPGQHFGEWWGQGIQRKYGMGEKRFSLFNVGRWHDVHGTNPPTITKRWDPKQRELSVSSDPAPACCYVVPVLETLPKMDTAALDMVLTALRVGGSKAAPGFMNPEGIVAYHAASKQLFKITCEKDEEPKGKAS